MFNYIYSINSELSNLLRSHNLKEIKTITLNNGEVCVFEWNDANTLCFDISQYKKQYFTTNRLVLDFIA